MLVVGFELDIAEFIYASFIQICLEWNNPQLSSHTPRSFAPQGSVVQFASYPPANNLSLKRGFCRNLYTVWEVFFFRVSSSILVVILAFEVSFHLFNGNIRPPPVSAPYRRDPPVLFTPKLCRRGHEQVLHDQFPLSKYAREIEGEHGWNTPIFVVLFLLKWRGW